MSKKRIIGNYLTQPNKDFPLDCETLDNIQGNEILLAVLGNIAGDKAILQGCDLESNNTRRKEGYVFVRTREYPTGEVLYWEGGSISAGIYVKKETVSITAQGNTYPQAYTVRSLAPGLGDENFSWADFKSIKTNRQLAEEKEAQDLIIAALAPPPLGMVQFWAGSTAAGSIPEGYMLCEGQQLRQTEYPELYKVIGSLHNATGTQSGFFCLPDLRSRFVVGFDGRDTDYNSQAKKGGEKKHTLTIEEMPKHSHRIPFNSWKAGDNANNRDMVEGTNYNHSRVAYVQEVGGSKAHENRPPYYTLAYIMRVK